MADYLPPVVAKLTGDESNLIATLTRAKAEVRKWAAEVGRMEATIQVRANLDTRVAADELALLTRARAVQIRADADTRVAADDLALLTRPRTVTINTNVTGNTNNLGGSGRDGGAGGLAALISLAPALIPVAASAASVAASVGAATVAVGAFGAAVIPQFKALGDASDAQKKYNDAVSKYGATSSQAGEAQAAFAKTMASMPPATRQAAGALMVFKDGFKSWSNDLSKFTMVPVTKSLALVQGILPKLNPMVKEFSGQFDRLVTVAAGGITTPGFDALSKKFTNFTDRVLTHATDELIHFSRVLSEGQANGPIAKFMEYAKTNGPAVRETLTNISKAVVKLMEGAAQAGPGMLALVNAAAKLVAALPPSFIARAMQLYTAFRLIKLASSGIGTASGGVTTLITQMTRLRAVSVAAGGGIAGLRAAFASLSLATKTTVVLAVLAGIAVAAYKLSESTREARISVDDLARSIEKGLAKGAISSPVIDDLRKAQQGLVKDTDSTASAWDRFAYSFTNWGAKFRDSGTSTQAAANDYRDLGNALGTIAQNKGVDTATQALQLLNREGVKIPTKYLTDYNSALADQQFEAKMAADSMGLFGAQAQAVQKKLAAQKASADGLRQSIQALNDVNRQGLDGEIGFEAAIDAATQAAKDNGRALKMKNGQLQLGTEKARNEATALSDLAAKTDANTAAARDSGKSWAAVNAIYTRGRQKLIASAEAMGLNTKDAKKLADQILKTPDKTAKVKGDLQDLQAKLASAKKQLASVPDSRKAKVQANIDQLKAQIAAAKRAIASLHGRTINIYSKYINPGKQPGTGTVLAPNADGSVIRGGVRRMADGGMSRPAMMARGGTNVLWAEGGDESYIPHDRRPRSRSIAEQTVAIMGGSVTWGNSTAKSATALGGHVAGGLIAGLTAGQGAVAAAAASLGKATIAAFSDELGIASPSKKFRALGAYVMHGLVQGLTGTTAQVKAATKRIASNLYVDFGSHHKSLQRYVARESKELQSLAGKRDGVAAKLKAAKTKLANLKKEWADEAKSIASGIMQGFSIVTTAPQEGFALTAQDVLNNLRTQMQKAVQFSANLDALKKKGLSSALIEQLATAGVDQAGDTATALLGASKGQLQQMNQMQTTTTAAANKTGKVVADAMYGAGIKSAQGLVKGLQSQEKAIERQMMRIAKAMQKAIKKALGIHSPSRVMAEIGDNTARGMAVGINRSTKHAEIAAQGLAMSVRQGATVTGGPLPLGGGRGAAQAPSYTLHLTVEGHVMTERNLRDVVEQSMLRLGMRNSGTYVPYKR